MANHFLSCLFLALCFGVSLGDKQFTVRIKFYDLLTEARAGADVVPRITRSSDGKYTISVTTSKGTDELKGIDRKSVALFAQLFVNPYIVITETAKAGKYVRINVKVKADIPADSISFSGGAKEFTVSTEYYTLLNEGRAAGLILRPNVTADSNGTYTITVTTSTGKHELKNLSKSLVELFARLFADVNLKVKVVSKSDSDVTISVSEITPPKTSKNLVCTSKCQQLDEKYHWCYTDAEKLFWDYCNASPGKTSLGRVCKSDSACGTHGEKYNWCHTTTGNWDYCAPN